MSIPAVISTPAGDGYVTSMTYMRDFLRYQSPVLLSFAAAWNGNSAPDFSQPFNYLDLGCGEGVTTVLLAAAYPHATFVGVDVNEEHIQNARDLAAQAGLTNLTFVAATFDAFRKDCTLDFNYIAAHGVYSWVSKTVAQSLIDAVDTLLAPAGLFYFCHYVHPGAGKMETLFYLLSELRGAYPDDIEADIKSAVKQAQMLDKQGYPLFKRYPSLRGDLEELLERDSRYLVHEFCNDHFNPRFFHEVVKTMGSIGLEFSGSPILERSSGLNLLTAGHQEGLSNLSGAALQSRASILSHELFRWDVFQRKNSSLDQQIKFDDFSIASTVFPYSYPAEAQLVRQNINLDTAAFRFVLEQTQQGVHRIRDIKLAATTTDISKDEVDIAIQNACAARLFQPVAISPNLPQAFSQTTYQLAAKASQVVWKRDFQNEGRSAYVSDVLGSAFTISKFDGLALQWMHGQKPREGLRQLAEELMSYSAKKLKKVGFKDKFTNEEFEKKSAQFLSQKLPLYVKYGLLKSQTIISKH